jgi:polyisoprenoid-binding protein YceI
MKKILLALSLLYTTGYAAGGCLLTQPNKIDVTWKAYKTLGKIGVGGKFTSVNYTPTALEGKNFKELFVGSKVVIDTRKIDSGNPDRDVKLVQFFFNKMSGGKIEGTIQTIKADPYTKGKPRTGIITVSITMNGKTLSIPMSYRYEKEQFDATGTIDLADFNALPALSSINKSCFELHKGKTWRDVTIGFHTTVAASLCDSNISR